MTEPFRCRHCGTRDLAHRDEHPDLCCDCFDLAVGMPLDLLNKERAAKGLPPLLPMTKEDPNAYR